MRYALTIAAVLVAVTACGSTVADHQEPATPETRRAMVLRIIDGDTFEVRLRGSPETVRMIGVNTPEQGRCYAAEATGFTRRQIARSDQVVYLVTDVSERGPFGRLLRYVWIDTAAGLEMLGARLVGTGHAEAVAYPPDVMHKEMFDSLEQQAQASARGVWGACPNGVQ